MQQHSTSRSASAPGAWRLLALIGWLAAAPLAHAAEPAPSAKDIEFFEAKVRPVLVKHCYECHSAQGKKAKGGLTVDSRAALLKGGDSGPAIVPGQPDKSLLIAAIRHADDDLRMPKQKLAQHEIDAVAQWIKIGAPDPRGEGGATPGAATTSRFDWAKERQHWAYQPIRNPEPAVVRDASWPRTEIDRFILTKLEGENLRPVADADPRTLIRRMTYDVTGLPPTPEEVEAFVRAHASDPRRATESLVDRLLASRHYGERWGRHWMDLVRYADTAGDNSDYPIPQAYLYRNYIIDAFNNDKPYDQFIREQIAGDLLPAKDNAQRHEQIIATGYLAMSRRFGSVVDRYPQHLTIEDTLDNIGKTYLGLTLACARCHDHKFDAITQRDYTALYGMFASTRYAFPGIELLKIQMHFVPLLSEAEAKEKLGPFMAKAAELQKAHDAIADKRIGLEARKADLEQKIATASGKEKAAMEAEVNRLEVETDKLRKQIRTAATAIENHQKTRPQVPDAYAVQDASPADAAVHLKGEPDRPGETVPRRWLELFGGTALPTDAAKASSGRRQLAEWIADPANPLTARVIVNRVWHYHFGSGLVKTPNDFGIRGQPPTHPELLDWLASRFVAEGWSFKKLHRQILLSRTYGLSSGEDAEVPVSTDSVAAANISRALSLDPNNDLHWRFNRRRLDAESLRDTLLALGGNLDLSPMTEPHPFPARAKWDFTQHHPFRSQYESTRRSVYLMTARLNTTPFFQTFDGPDRNVSTPARDSSVTSVQALFFLNDAFVRDQADRFAARLLKEASDDRPRIQRAFMLMLGRAPTADETTQIEKYLSEARTAAGTEKQKQTAWASVARALLRTNEFLYVD